MMHKIETKLVIAIIVLIFLMEALVLAVACPQEAEAETHVTEEEIHLPETEEIIILEESEVQEPVQQEPEETEEIHDVHEPEMIDVGTFKLTAYCNCRKCCGRWAGGPTASGTMPQEGRTIAVDKRVIPLGTKVYIDGYGEFVAEDTGSAIKGNRIDVYMDSHTEARHFANGAGSCKREVWIIK